MLLFGIPCPREFKGGVSNECLYLEKNQSWYNFNIQMTLFQNFYILKTVTYSYQMVPNSTTIYDTLVMKYVRVINLLLIDRSIKRTESDFYFHRSSISFLHQVGWL